MLNKVTLIGNLGDDPELRHIENGTAVASFSIATSETWKNKDGVKKSETQWHNCNIWGKPAETISNYCSKGSRLYVEGQIKYESYEKDGAVKYATKIEVREFKFLSTKSESNQTVNTNKPIGTDNSVDGPEDDDLPF